MAHIPVAEVYTGSFKEAQAAALSSYEQGTNHHSNIKPKTKISSKQFNILKQMGLLDGLAESIAHACEVSARRYWIVDNSGSMSIQDGKRIYGKDKLVGCTRWQELSDSLTWHASIANALDAHTEFRLLNSPRGFISKTVVIGGAGGASDDALSELQRFIQAGPSGFTPLCEALNSVSEV